MELGAPVQARAVPEIRAKQKVHLRLGSGWNSGTFFFLYTFLYFFTRDENILLSVKVTVKIHTPMYPTQRILKVFKEAAVSLPCVHVDNLS